MPRFKGPQKVENDHTIRQYAEIDIERAEQKIIDQNLGIELSNNDLIQNTMSFKIVNKNLGIYHRFKYFVNNVLHTSRSLNMFLPIDAIKNKEFIYVNRYYDTSRNIHAIYTIRLTDKSFDKLMKYIRKNNK
jgi:hypothetical protein